MGYRADQTAQQCDQIPPNLVSSKGQRVKRPRGAVRRAAMHLRLVVALPPDGSPQSARSHDLAL